MCWEFLELSTCKDKKKFNITNWSFKVMKQNLNFIAEPIKISESLCPKGKKHKCKYPTVNHALQNHYFDSYLNTEKVAQGKENLRPVGWCQT